MTSHDQPRKPPRPVTVILSWIARPLVVLEARRFATTVADDNSEEPAETSQPAHKTGTGSLILEVVFGGIAFIRLLFWLFSISAVALAVIGYHHAHTAEFKTECGLHQDYGYPLSIPDNALCLIFY